MVPWNSAKAKVQLRLGVQRLRTLQEKKNAQAKTARRDIAFLLEKGRIETARIKTENIINEDIYVELLELLELYCELLIARFGLLDQSAREPDLGVSEGVCAIIYAAPRTEIKELHVLRDILMHKYGREFAVAVMENRDGCVTERVTRKVAVSTPPSSLVDAYLAEIAKGYGVLWSPLTSTTDAGEGEGGVGVKAAADGKEKVADEVAAPARLLDAATISAEARSAGVRTPQLPQVPPVEEDVPPYSEENKYKDGTVKASPVDPPKKREAEEDEFQALAKRFEALKKR